MGRYYNPFCENLSSCLLCKYEVYGLIPDSCSRLLSQARPTFANQGKGLVNCIYKLCSIYRNAISWIPSRCCVSRAHDVSFYPLSAIKMMSSCALVCIALTTIVIQMCRRQIIGFAVSCFSSGGGWWFWVCQCAPPPHTGCEVCPLAPYWWGVLGGSEIWSRALC